MNPNFYVELSDDVKNNVNSVNANFYTETRSNPNFYVEDNAYDHHFTPDSSPSCSTKTSMHENVGQSTSVTEARNGITHSMKEKSSSSKPEREPEVSRRNLIKIRPIKYNCESPPLMRPVQVLVKAKNAQSNNNHQDMGHRQSTLMTDASVIAQWGRDNSTSSPLMKPAQQPHRNVVTAKNAKSNSIHSMHHNMGFKLNSATISEALNGITHSVRHISTSSPLEAEQVSHRNLVETKSDESNSSSLRLANVVHRLQSSLGKAKHSKSNRTHTMHHTMAHKLQSSLMSEALNGITHSVRHNSTSSPLEAEQVSHRNLVETKSDESNSSSLRLTKLVHRLQSSLVKAKHSKSNSTHTMHHTMAHKLQSSLMFEALNGLTHSVRHNSTSSPLMKVVSHRNLIIAKNERQEEGHQAIGYDLQNYSSNNDLSVGHGVKEEFNEFVNYRPASSNSLNNKSYELKRLENNVASRKARINRKKREDELSRKATEAKELNDQIHAELDGKYEELSELMYLIALLDGKVEPAEDDLSDESKSCVRCDSLNFL